jgi:prophage DNA circulation protein
VSILENTRAASYKGVPFHVRSSRTTEGVNRANFLYINTGRRVSKALGIYPPDFVLTAFTHGLVGQEYEERRDALRRVLNESGAGTLVHPFLGNYQVVAGKYSFVENFSEAGICKFTIPFFEADESGDNPIATSVSPSRIRSLGLDFSRDLQSAVADAFIATTARNKETTKSLFDKIGEALADVFGPLGSTIQKASDYAGKALDIQQQAAFYAANPQVGFAKIADSILGIDGLTNEVISKFKATKALFDYGDDGSAYPLVDYVPYPIVPIPPTQDTAQNTNNTGSFATFVKASSTGEAFSQAGNRTYETVDEVNDVAADLSAQFDRMKDEMTEEPQAPVYKTGVPTPDYSGAFESMSELKDAVEKYLEQQRLTAARVETITVRKVPASVLAYTLYGDSSRSEQILALNKIRDNMVLDGQIKVLSQ